MSRLLTHAPRPRKTSRPDVLGRVTALEVGQRRLESGQRRQGKTLTKLLESDERRTAREELLVTFITKVIPAVVVVVGSAVTGIVWLIAHAK